MQCLCQWTRFYLKKGIRFCRSREVWCNVSKLFLKDNNIWLLTSSNNFKLLAWDDLLGGIWSKHNVWRSVHKLIHTSRSRNLEFVVNQSHLGFVSITTLRKRYIARVEIIIWITIEIVSLIKKKNHKYIFAQKTILKAIKIFLKKSSLSSVCFLGQLWFKLIYLLWAHKVKYNL